MSAVIMVGAGGTGSHLLHPLVQYIAGNGRYSVLHIYDKDTVEDKNLERQLFYPSEVGQNKATALAKRFGSERVIGHSRYIGKSEDATPVDSAIKEGDTVLICADNMYIRNLINKHAKTLDDCLIINGGNEKHTGSVQVFLREKGKNITPPLDFHSPEFRRAKGPDISTLSCAEIANLPGGEQTVIANNSVAALMLQALFRTWEGVYTDTKEPQWTKQTFDFLAGTVQTSDVRLIGGFDA